MKKCGGFHFLQRRNAVVLRACCEFRAERSETFFEHLAIALVFLCIAVDGLDNHRIGRIIQLVVRHDGACHGHKFGALGARQGRQIDGPGTPRRDQGEGTSRDNQTGQQPGSSFEEFPAVQIYDIIHILSVPGRIAHRLKLLARPQA